MTVGEARKTYGYQLKSYNMKAYEISTQQKSIKDQMKLNPDKKDMFQEQLDSLQIDYDAVQKKYEEYRSYMDQVMAQWEATFQSEQTKQQTEAAKEYGEDMGKIMTVARRMMKGDTVPSTDEKKLMEFDKEVYQVAKQMQMMAQMERRRHKNHKSLWEDEKPKEYEDPMEKADSEELNVAGPAPEVVDVETTLADAHSGESE